MDINYLPLTDMRIARTFCFTNGGQALYLSSPTEIQRITYSQEMCDNLQVRAVALFSAPPPRPTRTPRQLFPRARFPLCERVVRPDSYADRVDVSRFGICAAGTIIPTLCRAFQGKCHACLGRLDLLQLDCAESREHTYSQVYLL